jgi:hypothetical protein
MVAILCASHVAAQQTPVVPETTTHRGTPTGETRAVDLVFCLDVSGSMDQLLDEVRARLWEVVNEFGGMSPRPALRIGLMTYGSGKVGPETGRIVIDSDLTSDLGRVYSTLMEIETSGDSEYVGWAIHTALEQLSWSNDEDALKILLIAGNEPADQALEHYDFRSEARRAFDEGVSIHALYAGNREAAIANKWPELAEWSQGTYVPVRPAPNIVNLSTPQDSTLKELNDRYNATFVPIGIRGTKALDQVVEQDRSAEELGSQSLGSRIATKAGGLLGPASWDLVDVSRDPEFNLASVDPADLPEEFRHLPYGDLLNLLEEKRLERETLESEMLESDEIRREFLRSKSTRRGRTSVVDAMREAVRRQAESRGFKARRAR